MAINAIVYMNRIGLQIRLLFTRRDFCYCRRAEVMLICLYMGVDQTSRKVGTFAKINNQ